MIEKAASYIQQKHMIEKGDHVIAGVSGGADSVCLFLLLKELSEPMGFTFSVVHIEHGIRGEESIKDAHFVEKLCQENQVGYICYPFEVEEIAKEKKMTTEEAGRMVRYESFQKEADKIKLPGSQVKIAVAHHANDQAETVLFHMARGCGVDGMAGIWPVRNQIIRPLLFAEREEIERFLRDRKQPFCVDDTNTDIAYARNQIRECVLKELEKVNVKAVVHIAQMAEKMQQLSTFLAASVKKAYGQCIDQKKKGELLFFEEAYRNQEKLINQEVVRLAISELSGSRKDITEEHILSVCALFQKTVGRQIDLPYALAAERRYEGVRIYKKEEPKERKQTNVYGEIPAGLEIGAEGHFPLKEGEISYRIFECSSKVMEKIKEIPGNSYTKCFDYDKIQNGLLFRNRCFGDYLTIDGDNHTKKINDYFVNEKVPRERRDEIVLAAEGSHVIWVMGYRISEAYKLTPDTSRIVEVHFRRKEA